MKSADRKFSRECDALNDELLGTIAGLMDGSLSVKEAKARTKLAGAKLKRFRQTVSALKAATKIKNTAAKLVTLAGSAARQPA